MTIIKDLIGKIKEASFKPSLFSFLFNPYYIMRSSLYNAIKLLSRNASGDILDFGCGSMPYRKLFANATSYVGCDIQMSGHDHSNSNVDYFYDGKTLPFPNQKFDWVVSFETFEHIFNMDEILGEIRRISKNDGYVLITVPFSWDEHEEPYDFARYTSYGLTHILERNGLEVVRYIKTGSYILVITQLFTAYLARHIFPKSRYVKYLLTPFLIMPFHALAYILHFILPRKQELFLGSVVLCKKSKLD